MRRLAGDRALTGRHADQLRALSAPDALFLSIYPADEDPVSPPAGGHGQPAADRGPDDPIATYCVRLSSLDRSTTVVERYNQITRARLQRVLAGNWRNWRRYRCTARADAAAAGSMRQSPRRRCAFRHQRASRRREADRRSGGASCPADAKGADALPLGAPPRSPWLARRQICDRPPGHHRSRTCAEVVVQLAAGSASPSGRRAVDPGQCGRAGRRGQSRGSPRRRVFWAIARTPARRHRSVELQEARRSAGHRRRVPCPASIAEVRHRALCRSRPVRSPSIPTVVAGCLRTVRSMPSSCSKRSRTRKYGRGSSMAARARARRTARHRRAITMASTEWRQPRYRRVWPPTWVRCGKSATPTPRTWRPRSTRRSSSGARVSAKRWRWPAGACAKENPTSTSSSRERQESSRARKRLPPRSAGWAGMVLYGDPTPTVLQRLSPSDTSDSGRKPPTS